MGEAFAWGSALGGWEVEGTATTVGGTGGVQVGFVAGVRPSSPSAVSASLVAGLASGRGSGGVGIKKDVSIAFASAHLSGAAAVRGGACCHRDLGSRTDGVPSRGGLELALSARCLFVGGGIWRG